MTTTPLNKSGLARKRYHAHLRRDPSLAAENLARLALIRRAANR